MLVLSHMSENTMTIDFSSVENIEDFRSVPEGDYPCRISEIRESKSPAGHSRWGILWEVCHGEWQGRTACWDSLHGLKGVCLARNSYSVFLGLQSRVPWKSMPVN